MDTLPFGWTVHAGDQKGDDPGLLKEGVIDNKTNTHVQDLFHEDAQGFQQPSQPWWRIKVFVWEPVLFGTWDGVFTTCMINIFGVVLFLRTGYLVGNTGVLLGMLLVSSVVLVALVTVMSGIGVCEHCGVGSGGIYSMISTVLGGRVGGTMGLLYVFGQCSAGAMYITGFSESVAELLGLQTQWAVRGMSAAVLLALLGINLAGVKWIVRIQLLLLAVLAISTLDFVVGSFTHLDPEHGFIGYSAELLSSNTKPDYTPGENFFTVFGVFFPAATGVMAGFNMSSDLQRPEQNIPVGTLAALFTSWFLYLVFAFLLGAICTREALRYDFLIAEKVSLVGFLFLLGLYVSSLASCMGGLYGAPRILQCIAQERVIPALACLGKGKGPNKTPVAAICLTSLLTMAFIFIGQVNVLAPIVTINFMLTYSFIDYSYFSVAMTFRLQSKEKRDALTLARRNQRRSATQSSRPLLEDPLPNYGSGGESPQSKGTLSEFTKDMDQMFPPVSNVDAGAEKSFSLQELSSRGKGGKATPKQTLMDSFGLDLNRNMFSEEEKGEETWSPPPYEQGRTGGKKWPGSFCQTGPLNTRRADAMMGVGRYIIVMGRWIYIFGHRPTGDVPGIPDGQSAPAYEEAEVQPGSGEPRAREEESQVKNCTKPDLGADHRNHNTGAEGKAEQQSFEIKALQDSVYAKFSNHWVALIGALTSLVIMFVIQWVYALANIVVALLLYFYIGKTSPGLPIGIAARFSFFTWLKSTLSSICRGKGSPRDEVIVTPSLSGVGLKTRQLTEENADFASRHRYHQSSFIVSDKMVQTPSLR